MRLHLAGPGRARLVTPYLRGTRGAHPGVPSGQGSSQPAGTGPPDSAISALSTSGRSVTIASVPSEISSAIRPGSLTVHGTTLQPERVGGADESRVAYLVPG